jgi:hypothetical protein
MLLPARNSRCVGWSDDQGLLAEIYSMQSGEVVEHFCRLVMPLCRHLYSISRLLASTCLDASLTRRGQTFEVG